MGKVSQPDAGQLAAKKVKADPDHNKSISYVSHGIKLVSIPWEKSQTQILYQINHH
jgi:hypothetical protein